MKYIKRQSKDYHFLADKDTGVSFRWGKTASDNPQYAPWPELADISISNHCTKNCSYCYRDSKNNNEFMSIEDYQYLLLQLKSDRWGNVFQVALGGGEPLEHPDFLEIIDITNAFNVIPNFTTNGIHFTESIADKINGKVGALAVSTSNIYDLKGFNKGLVNNRNYKVNIHYLLTKENVEQANEILDGEHNHFIEDFNAIVFLTYKPFGRASEENMLFYNNNLNKFLSKIEINKCKISIGFDACFVPLLLCHTNINPNLIDPCECGFFSVYIDEKLNVKPCSFANNDLYSYNLRDIDFETIWIKYFKEFRKEQINTCNADCGRKIHCRGECYYYPEITLCRE